MHSEEERRVRTPLSTLRPEACPGQQAPRAHPAGARHVECGCDNCVPRTFTESGPGSAQMCTQPWSDVWVSVDTLDFHVKFWICVIDIQSPFP